MKWKIKQLKNNPHLNFGLNLSAYIIFIFSAVMPFLTNTNHINADFLALSLSNIKRFRLWTIFTFHIVNTDILFTAFTLFFLALIFKTLKKHLSSSFMFRYLFQCSLIASAAHIFTANSSSYLAGLTTSLSALLPLLAKKSGKKAIFKLKSRIFILNHLIFPIILLNILTAQAPFRKDSVSVTSQIAVLLYAIFFIKKNNFSEKPLPLYDTYEKKAPANPINNLPTDDEIDLILDKINQKGLDSLSAEEKKRLELASKKSK